MPGATEGVTQHMGIDITKLTDDELNEIATDPDRVHELDMTDPALVARIAKLGGDDAPGDDGEAPGGERGEGAPAQEQQLEEGRSTTDTSRSSQQPDGGKKPDGIASKNGKHIIDYAVLEQERAEKEAAQAAARQLAAVIEAMEAQITAGRSSGTGKPASGDPPPDEFSDSLAKAIAEAERLKTDYPDLAPAQTAYIESLQTLAQQVKGALDEQQNRLAQIEDVARRQQEGQFANTRKTSADAMAEVPALVVWRTKSPELFQLATQFDTTLRRDNDWQGKPLVERFQKAVEMVVAVKGAGVLEGVTPIQSKTKTDEAKARQVIADNLGISSLSDLPGGSAVDAQGGIEGLSDSQMVEMVDRLASNPNPNSLFGFLGGAIR